MAADGNRIRPRVTEERYGHVRVVINTLYILLI